jgi:hypothetical protein
VHVMQLHCTTDNLKAQLRQEKCDLVIIQKAQLGCCSHLKHTFDVHIVNGHSRDDANSLP